MAGCYAWGHHLAAANLLYHLQHGDKFIVTFALKEGSENAVPIIIKKAWLGTKRENPMKSAESVYFASWLIERKISEDGFLKWIQNELPARPYFPFKSEEFEGKVIMLIREKPTGDGGLVRITKDGDHKDSLAVFEREDFYLCGVQVGEADMRFLVRPGDSVQMQIKELSERDKKAKFKKYPKLEEFEIAHSCLLAYIGSERPTEPRLAPDESEELARLLEGKGMSVAEFARMRGGSTETDRGQEKPTDQSVEGTAGLAATTGSVAAGAGAGLAIPSPAMLASVPPPGPSFPAPDMARISRCSELVAKVRNN